MKRSAIALGVLFSLASAVLPAAVMAQQGGQGGGRQGGPRQGGFRGLTGRVAAKGENSLDVQPMRRGEAGEAVKVTLEEATRFSRIDQAAAADLTEGYLVAVVGDREGDKMAAKGILRLSKIEGKPKIEEVVAARMLGMFLNRMAGRRPPQGQPGQGQPDAMAAFRPVVGKVVSLQPLTVETLPFGPDQQAEKVEIQGADAARIVRLADAKLDDVKTEGLVMVIPKEGAEGQPITARAVLILPPMGQGAGGGRRGQ